MSISTLRYVRLTSVSSALARNYLPLVAAPRLRSFSTFQQQQPIDPINRVSRFIQRLSNGQVTRSEVLAELRALLFDIELKDTQGQVREIQDARGGANGKSKWLRFRWDLLIFGVVLYSLISTKTGGLPGFDADVFQNNFQEFDPRPQAAAKSLNKNTTQQHFEIVKFANVMGNEDAKEELQDLVDYLKHPEKYKDMALTLPKGVLLSGPPGTGKTLLARALAGEAGVPFLNCNGSSFDQMFVGLGAQRMRKLFQRARELAPCIIFIDEIDAVGGKRDSFMNYTRQTLNQLLSELDGFSKTEGVIIIGATNVVSSLDSALIRPGRFDRTVPVSLPDKRVRKSMIDTFLKGRQSSDVDLDLLAAGTPGFSGADLNYLVNRAGIEAVKKNMKKITQGLLIEAQETIMMGRASPDRVMSDETKKLVSYHEAGHALVGLLNASANPIYKATILPRGGALGFVAYTRKEEHLMSKEAMLAEMDVCMAGRAAEELVFGSEMVTQGASSDFQHASSIARNMVMRFGMGGPVGHVYHTDEDLKSLSPDAQAALNDAVKVLVDESYQRAKTLLKSRHTEHHKLAQYLLQEETLSAAEIRQRLNLPDLHAPPAIIPPVSTPETLPPAQDGNAGPQRQPLPKLL